MKALHLFAKMPLFKMVCECQGRIGGLWASRCFGGGGVARGAWKGRFELPTKLVSTLLLLRIGISLHLEVPFCYR